VIEPLAKARRVPHELRDLRRRWQLTSRVGRDLRVPPPSAFASFGAGSWIVPPARVNSPDCVAVGEAVVLLENAWLAVYPQPGLPRPRLSIGDRTRIGRGAHIACIGEVTIEDSVLTADSIYIADTYHGFDDPDTPIGRQPMAAPRPVVIKRGAFLGIRSVILPGVTVGNNAYVAAGAVVSDDVPDRTVVAGNPARPVRVYDEATNEWRPVSDDRGGAGGPAAERP
jgi:acetyltransferase-like isoleucine patch superfamily enzyme